MGILEQTAAKSNIARNTAASNVRRNTATNAPRETDPSQFWLNIGYEAKDGRFVYLPYGLPLDTMGEVRTGGQSEEFVALAHARNLLKQDLLEEAGQLEPGQDVPVNLQVRLRRINSKILVDNDTNPFKRPSQMSLIAHVEEHVEEEEGYIAKPRKSAK